MTIDRRSFLYAGGMTAAVTPFATAAHAAASQTGQTIADFGISPDPERDQTGTLQKAIDGLIAARQPIIFPPGEYVASTLTFPGGCTVIGFPGMTNLRVVQALVNHGSDLMSWFNLSGLIFEASRKNTTAPKLAISRAEVRIGNCWFEGWEKSGVALELTGCTGMIDGISVARYPGSGILATQSRLTVSGCRFEACGSAVVSSSKDGSTLAQNHFEKCGVGITADGVGVVTGNTIAGATKFGLKLGSAKGSGHILAQSNLIRDCRIGIGVSASGDDIMASLNMIAGAKDGAIRAFDGDKLVGPDLARQSAEAYLNLMVAGNVVR